MCNITISVIDENGSIMRETQGSSEAFCVYEPEYALGDAIRVRCEEPDSFLVLQLDDAVLPGLALLKGSEFIYRIPFDEAKSVYSTRAFSGKRHLIHVRLARADELEIRRNLAFNPWATHERSGLYPFASANVETRGEMVFAAKNAIDGNTANDYHGEWPYTSWGINRDPKAALRLEFGRPVVIDEAVVYLRADFPHDAWWEKGTLHFSDGGEVTLEFKKSASAQSFSFEPRRVEWVVLDTLIKADDPSPFPALTQLELWGREG